MSQKQNNSNDLAEQRTDWAEDRTVQATERTYAGWLRTAFAAIGIGLGFRALFGEFDPPWLAKGIATCFILIGAAVAWSAQNNASKTMARLQTHSVDAPKVLHMRWLSYLVAAGALTLAIALWFLREAAAD